MDKTNLTQRRQAEDDSDLMILFGEAYCTICTERIEFCRCEPGEGANRLDSSLEDLFTDSDLLEDVEYTRMRRLSTEFAQVGGVRDF